MKRAFAIFYLICLSARSFAEEGMWLPMLLGDQVYANMVKKGLKLSKEQLFSINKTSLKDAIVSINGLYSGSIVSPEGLLFTGYHCAYEAMGAASQDGQSQGFYAHSRKEEIPVSGIYADFLLKIDDVTSEIDDSLKGLNGLDRATAILRVSANISKRYLNNRNGIMARVTQMFKGVQSLAFIYQRYQDLRVVAIPPAAAAQFSLAANPWQWPQYAERFSLFRIYTGTDGNPALFNNSNIPLRSKSSLSISLKGIKENDYSMIYGFPGSSQRNEFSLSIKERTEITDPSLVKITTLKNDYLLEEMKKDPAVESQLSKAYLQTDEKLSYYSGELNALVKSNLYDNKVKNENAFQQWSQGDQEYVYTFRDWAKLYSFWKPYARHRIYVTEGITASPLVAFVSGLQAIENALVRQGGGDLQKLLANANKARQEFLKNENKASDRKILAGTTKLFYTDIEKAQHPIGFYESIKGSFGDLRDENTFTKYATAVFANTMIFDDAKWNAFISNPDATVLQEDPAYKHASSFLTNWKNKYDVYYRQFIASDNDLGRQYMRGMIKMDPKIILYPDANQTLRLSYGTIKSYNPQPSVHYDYACTMKGLLDKYQPGKEDQDLPATFVDLARKKDFGQYADKLKNDLVLTFVSTNDISASSEGSAVLNGSGELIGLAASVNYEALNHQYVYDPTYTRSICVDIRYILWTIEKAGGAANIISELKLLK